MHIQPALAGGGGDGGGQIKAAFAGARPLAQGAEREFQAAWPQFGVGIKVAKLALFPDLDSTVMRALPADAHPFGIVAGIAKGRGAACADPFIAALMAALLLGQPVAQGIHQRLQAA